MALWANSIGCWRKGRNAKGLGVTNICLMEGWEQRDRVVVACLSHLTPFDIPVDRPMRWSDGGALGGFGAGRKAIARPPTSIVLTLYGYAAEYVDSRRIYGSTSQATITCRNIHTWNAGDDVLGGTII
ncbi:uncharacterized protein CIMG_01559 [Coccidioides immitis RS]|uniref:Uncharacterized protein n=1 Tax=Coccidioides immitis (strain RS) TaxID=246410 RepID=J3KJG3_COCIM|nr:uncharacterized protein CIMG_01559 [Coccidioides immitis RS]EAS36205.3 hypothetical protein CIMG_01559 [Coccidioides immitis RS]